MRELKFRGKRVDNGEWVCGDLLQPNLIVTDWFNDTGTHVFALEAFAVIPATIGQFTGLLDCNGKEIYEGDIMLNKNAKVFVIVYRGGGFCAMSPREYCLDLAGCSCTISDPLGERQSSDYFQEQCWVIGNVHERSELLDVAEG